MMRSATSSLRRPKGLAALRELGGVATPEVILAGRELLVLSVLQPGRAARPSGSSSLMCSPACTMSTTHPRFGWHRDNWLCRRKQTNTWNDDGFAFFAQHRLLRWLGQPRVEAALDPTDRAALQRLCHRLPDLLPDRPACLTHVWSTAPPPEAQRFFAVYAELTCLDGGWQARMPIIQLRQHLTVLAQFDDDCGAGDQICATLAPFRTRT